MKVVSVSVGMPRLIEYYGEPLATGIYKNPVEGKVAVNQLNLAGDAQADLSVHGGVSKSVYAYPFEHYEFWQKEYPNKDLPIAIFGENLTTEGILETEICSGDKIRIGTAEFTVTEPRFPCFKLGIRFGEKDILRRFQKSRRIGFYLSVAKTGELEAGDTIEFIERDPNEVTIKELFELSESKSSLDIARRALKVDALPERWKQQLRKIIG